MPKAIDSTLRDILIDLSVLSSVYVQVGNIARISYKVVVVDVQTVSVLRNMTKLVNQYCLTTMHSRGLFLSVVS